MIYKKVILENTEPWQSHLPPCKCSSRNNGRVILYEGKIYCGSCGMAYARAGSVGLALVEEVELHETTV